MPELPEVETIVRGLDRRVTGDAIGSVWIGTKRQPLKSPAGAMVATLEGKQIVRVHRAGKHIVFDLERAVGAGSANGKGTAESSGGPIPAGRGRPQRLKPHSNRIAFGAPESAPLQSTEAAARRTRAKVHPTRGAKGANRQAASLQADHAKAQWIVHLGMTGRMVVCEPAAEVVKHTHLIAQLASGRELRFIDPRMFGKLSVHREQFNPGGIEPLEVTEDEFVTLFRGRKTPIKSALLNQKLLRGVGNIYADESLFRTGIRPRRRVATLTREQLLRLRRSVQEVLREAIALGGSSISDYVDADGEEGFFQLQHRVYGREGEPCLVCHTPVKRVVIAGRSSHYCPHCQK